MDYQSNKCLSYVNLRMVSTKVFKADKLLMFMQSYHLHIIVLTCSYSVLFSLSLGIMKNHGDSSVSQLFDALHKAWTLSH